MRYQVVVRRLEIGLYFDRSLKRCNRSGRVAARFELPAEVCLCFGIFRIDLDRFAKLGRAHQRDRLADAIAHPKVNAARG